MDDMASSSLFVLDLNKATYDAFAEPMLSHINVGMGSDLPLNFHPAATGARLVFTPVGAS